VTRTRERLRSTLIVAQVAVATVVLIAAGLLLRSFDLLSRVEPGFSLEQRVTFRLAPDWATYPKRERARVLYDTFLEKLAATPGTISVAAVNRLPLTGSWWTTQYEIAERPAEPGREPTAIYRVITSDYLSTMGISLVSGRGIENTDRADVRPVVVVSRALAERGWPGASPLGRRITFQPGDSTAVWYTVVGIVSDVRTSGLADEPAPMAYVSFAQAGFGHFSDWGMDVVVHTRSAQSAVIVAARRTLEALAPGIPLFEPRPLTDLVARDLARRRFLVLLLGVFAATAMTLAGLGLYGVVAYGVAQRRGELGLRMALGAGSVQVWRSVVARSLALAALGVAGGVPAAAVAGRLMTALLYGVTPLDPATFVAVSGAVLLIAGVAGGVPAFRASHVSPMEALRND
jgi:putative ABC transport system permease protein